MEVEADIACKNVKCKNDHISKRISHCAGTEQKLGYASPLASLVTLELIY